MTTLSLELRQSDSHFTDLSQTVYGLFLSLFLQQAKLRMCAIGFCDARRKYAFI